MSFSFHGAVDILGGGGWVKCKIESLDFRSPVVGISVNSQLLPPMHISVRMNKLLSFNA